MARRAAVLALAALLLGGCGGGGGHASASTSPATAETATATRRSAPAPAPTLTASRPCPRAPGFTCSTLAVPLDRSGRVPGTLRLRVAVADNAGAPRGVMLFLTGGPGQPGVPFAARVRREFRSERRAYRLVVIDQRGTGAGALRCPALQKAVGTSDLTVPPPKAVTACARRLGPRREFFSTADTVADFDDLRAALGERKLTIDGVSYGTFVAERYAIAHPGRVARLVLDSIVPADSLDGLETDGMRRSATVLRAVCRVQRCPSDPAADLAAVVRRYHDGPALDDTIVALSVGAPSYPGLATALREARAGRPQRLRRLVAIVHRAQAAPAGVLSSGLHAATLCADLRAPWASPSTPLAGRVAAVRRAAAASNPFPFDGATVAGNGLIQTCLRWPAPRTQQPQVGRRLPPVPTLLLAGDRDLSTPLPWAREQLAATPRGRLVVVHGSGHSTQSRDESGTALRAVARFLLG
jgi:pimeloyl-ACP methyl ester carboxylesterase